jgi:hypothetical protein
MSSDVRAVGLPCDRLVQPFRARLVDRSPTTVPHRWHDGFSSLRLCAFYRVLRSRPAPDYRFGPKTFTALDSASLGVRLPSSRSRPMVSTRCGAFPSHRYVPSSAFLTPSTVYSTIGFAGLFHPTAVFRVLPSGGFPLDGAAPGFPGRCPPAVGLAILWCYPGQTTRPRLQGFALRKSPGAYASD